MSEISKILDALDETREAEDYLLPWSVDGRRCIVEADGGEIGDVHNPADAALIVAAVNALPRLVAALRAVLEVHSRFVDSYGITRDWCGHDPDDSWPCPTVRAVTAALAPAAVAAGDTDNEETK